MSTHATTASHRGALVNAKTVGWALTAITAAALLLGLAVVQILGRQTPQLDVEKEPSHTSRESAPQERAQPIILEEAAAPRPSDALTAPRFEQSSDGPSRFGARDPSPEARVR